METSLFCPLANGCEWTGERLLLDSHCKDCPYELLECPYCMQLVVKINEHLSNCNKREVPCPKCDQKVIYEALVTHDETCTSKQAECPHCSELFDSQSLDSHIRNCPLKQTACEYSQFGCGWNGIVSDLKDHLNACPLAAIKGFIQIHQQQISSLKEENQKLVEAIGDLESHCYRLNCKILEMETNRIFTENMPGVPPVVIDNLALDVQLLKSELESLNMNLAHSELKHDQQFLAENIRLRDEMQALRAICQSVQTQLYNLAIHKSNNPNMNITHKSTNSKLGKPVDGNPLNKL
ncbi:hypothetical protein HDV04_000255 [Boothiomyces sp. JEL0838]|nr:hypothetical protein HDV04_000255 [Boothiomyces sp. JEL0838]